MGKRSLIGLQLITVPLMGLVAGKTPPRVGYSQAWLHLESPDLLHFTPNSRAL